VAAALLAAGCGDVVNPKPSTPGTPEFATAAAAAAAASSGITLDQTSGSLGQSGTMLGYPFNPNPHLGDAIVATFVWKSANPANIINSVTDVLMTSPFTPVGNHYKLVEFVSAGGISMATYVATNVQNFPSPNQNDAQRLAVLANLSTSVPDGGVLISAWTGVSPDSALALGAHSRGSGAGSSATVADAGPIPVNAGALAYAVNAGGENLGA